MKLGASDLDVSRMGLGGNVFGWTADDAASRRILDAYVDAGGTFIDTADGYSAWVDGNAGGESEAVIGSWLRRRRDDVVIATKVSTKPDRTGLAADNVREALDESLTRLKTDHVDLYYAHFDDPDTPLEETVAVFEELRAAGKTRYVALSNYTPERIEQWCAIADAMGAQAPVALQPHYNLLHRGDVEGAGNRGEVAAAHGMGLVPYFSLAAGFLTGKYHPSQTVTAEPAAIALTWLRDRPGVVAPLASARTTDQLDPILTALTLHLAPEEIDRLTRVSDAA